jgi:hypothetical protein
MVLIDPEPSVIDVGFAVTNRVNSPSVYCVRRIGVGLTPPSEQPRSAVDTSGAKPNDP